MATQDEYAIKIALQARDEFSNVLASMSGQLKGVTSILTRFAAGAGPLGGLAIAGTAVAVATVIMGKSLADATEQLDRIHDRTGLTIEQWQILSRTIKDGGGNAESLSVALNFLNRAIATQDPLLGKLGITTHDTYQAFLQLTDILSNSPDVAKRTEIAYQLLGRGSADLLGNIKNLRGQIAIVSGDMTQLGGVISGKTADSARLLDAELDKLGRRFDAAMMQAKMAVLPTAIVIIESMNSMWDAVSGRRITAPEIEDKGIRKLEDNIKTIEGLISSLLSKRPDNAAFPDVAKLIDDQIVKLQERQAALRRQIGIIKGTVKEMGADDLDPFGRERTGGDSLADIDLAKDKAGEPSAREKRIQHIIELLHVTREVATNVVASLEAVEATNERIQLDQQLGLTAPPSPFGQAAQDIEDAMAQADEEAQLHQKNIQHAIELTLAAISAQAEAVTAAIQTAVDVLENGLMTAFSGIIAGGQRIDDFFKRLFAGIRAAVDQLVSTILTRLAIFGILKAFGVATGPLLPFLSSGVIPKVAAISGGSGSESVGALQATATTSQTGAEQAPPSHVEVNISSFDSRSWEDQMRSVFGLGDQYAWSRGASWGFS